MRFSKRTRCVCLQRGVGRRRGSLRAEIARRIHCHARRTRDLLLTDATLNPPASVTPVLRCTFHAYRNIQSRAPEKNRRCDRRHASQTRVPSNSRLQRLTCGVTANIGAGSERSECSTWNDGGHSPRNQTSHARDPVATVPPPPKPSFHVKQAPAHQRIRPRQHRVRIRAVFRPSRRRAAARQRFGQRRRRSSRRRAPQSSASASSCCLT
jgi:hypothetical protein